MWSESAHVVYAVDGGGSRTEVRVTRARDEVAAWSTGSFAIASVGAAIAQGRLQEILRAIADYVGPGTSALGCIASSSMPVMGEAPAPVSLVETVRGHAPAGWVVLVNDVIPLLWSLPVAGRGIVACSGTGSCVLGSDAAGNVVKVGGHEHIVSDQGSGYSIAREGLRAAVREIDGTGPPTSLRPAAEALFYRPLPALGRWLAEMPQPRQTVASFAPCVLDAAEAGDDVANAILDREAAALALAVQVAATRLRLPRPRVGLAGGVLLEGRTFRERFLDGLVERGVTDTGRDNITCLDGPRSGLSYARLVLAEASSGPGSGTVGVPDGQVIEISDQRQQRAVH